MSFKGFQRVVHVVKIVSPACIYYSLSTSAEICLLIHMHFEPRFQERILNYGYMNSCSTKKLYISLQETPCVHIYA